MEGSRPNAAGGITIKRVRKVTNEGRATQKKSSSAKTTTREYGDVALYLEGKKK